MRYFSRLTYIQSVTTCFDPSDMTFTTHYKRLYVVSQVERHVRVVRNAKYKNYIRRKYYELCKSYKRHERGARGGL